MRLTTDLFAYCHERVPRWNTISISGYHFREKGCSAVQEVAFTLCSGIAYVQAADREGPQRRRVRPAAGLLLQRPQQRLPGGRQVPRRAADVGAHHARAVRRDEPASATMLRFHTQTGGVTLTAQQPENNIVRVALQGFAAVCGGTQSLHTNGFDEALALPTERAAKIALRTQQILADESGAADTVDPFAGSYYVESLTDEIEAARAGADRQGRRAGRLGQCDRVHHRRDRRVRLGLPGALPHRPGHRRRRQRLPGGGHRGPRPAARRPRVRARAGRTPERVQGQPRPGARGATPGGAARDRTRERRTCCRRSARR